MLHDVNTPNYDPADTKERSLPLEQKLELTTQRMEACLTLADPDAIWVAWTGGKDSTVVLYLWKECIRKKGLPTTVRALNLDTGYKFPEVLSFRDDMQERWQIDLVVARPENVPDTLVIAQDPVACCQELKVKPLQKAIVSLGIQLLMTGVRWDEHESRADRQWAEKRKDPDYWSVNPILHWSEMDIWSFHMAMGIPHCELYNNGYRSLGCLHCTRKVDQDTPGDGERQGRSRSKEEQLKTLHSLGYF